MTNTSQTMIAPGGSACPRPEDSGLLQQLLATTQDGFLMVDPRTARVIQANAVFCNMLGYTEDEMLQLSIPDFEASETPDETHRHIATLLAAGNDRFETTHRRKDGSVCDVEISASLAQGACPCLMIFVRDISERMQEARALDSLLAETTGVTGLAFFRALVKWLCQRLGADMALVCEASGPHEARCLALLLDGMYVEGYSYSLKGTPCEQVLEQGFCYYPKGIQRLFPEDQDLADQHLEGYAGVALRDGTGRMTGHICLLTRKELVLPKWAEAILRMLASRTRAELERLRAEEAQQESERLLAQSQEIAHIGSWKLDLAGRRLTWTDEVFRIFGLGAGKPDPSYEAFLQAVHPDDRDLLDKAYTASLQPGQPGYELEHRIIRHDTGEVRFVHEKCVHERDESGAVVKSVGMVRDVTETVKREAESRVLFRAIENAPASVVITDPKGDIVYVNPRFTEVTGYTREEAMGQNPRVLKSDQHEPDFYRDMWGIISHGDTWRGELINKRKDGTLFWEAASISPILDDHGDIVNYVAVKEDITESKEAEIELLAANQRLIQANALANEMAVKAEMASKAKSEFLANMSHEIRTPMNAITGLSHLLLQAELPARQHDYVSRISTAAHNLLGIINDILDFSKIEAGKLKMEKIPFSLDSVLDGLNSVVAIKAGEKGLDFTCAVAPDVPNDLKGDPLRLGQILINLCNNAVKFTERGAIGVTVERLADETPSSAPPDDPHPDRNMILRFTVKDTGIGMTPDQQRLLFQSFTQADGSHARKYGGTGQGLAICKRLVELMNGKIEVESAMGRGSTFSFTITVEHPDSCKLVRKPCEGVYGMRVLVVDDTPSVRVYHARMLNALHFQVTMAASGAEALLLVKEASQRGEPFRLVLMDWGMPGMDGIKAACAIREVAGLSCVPKIILLTAYGREEVVNQARQAGLDGILNKPVNRSLLLDAITDLFDQSPPETILSPPAKSEQDETLESIRGARVLLVEDNETNQIAEGELLRKMGLVVDVANSGIEAVEAASSRSYDLIFMDIQMPGMDGLEATRRIRACGEMINEEGKTANEEGVGGEGRGTKNEAPPGGRSRPASLCRVPIVAMTAHAMSGDREVSRAAGMDDHITKPVDPKEVARTLVKWIPAGTRMPRDERVPHDGAEQPGVSPIGWDEADLPGLRIMNGLARVCNNRALYGKLLRGFRKRHRHAAERLPEWLANGCGDDAMRLAHTLASAAGNVGAEELSVSARRLELALRHGEHDTRELLAAFQERMREAIRSIDEALSGPLFQQQEKTADGPLDVEAALEQIGDTLDALKKDVAEAMEKMEEIQALPFDEDQARLARKAASKLGEFDISQTQQLLEALAAALTAGSGQESE